MRILGCAPDRQSTRTAQCADRSYRVQRNLGTRDSSVFVLKTNSEEGYQQPIYDIHDQLWPSCAGESFGACIEARVGYKVSSIGIWRDARRRQGAIENIQRGTRLEYCIESLMQRGWDRYEKGEESSPEELTKNDDLDSEMEAYDNREPQLEHFRIDTDQPADRILDQVDSALLEGYSVVFGTGVQDPYMDYYAASHDDEKVIGADWLSGSENGHAQRIFACCRFSNGERRYGVQGSWSENWGGMTLLNGIWQPGCCWVTSEVLLVAWDIHVAKLKI